MKSSLSLPLLWNYLKKHLAIVYCILLTIGVALLFCLYRFCKPDIEEPLDDTKTLKLVHVVFRHGHRTPLSTYPKDPYLNETFYPYGLGQVTNEGKKFSFQSGQWLRQRYGRYLGKVYVPDAVWAQSSYLPRTEMSLGAALAGLFPPKYTVLDWNSELNWQPIPIFVEPLYNESLLLVHTPCPRYNETRNEVFKGFLAEHAQLLAELTKITGMEYNTTEKVQMLYSTLRAESEYGLKLPEWTNEYYPDQLMKLSEECFGYNAYNKELKTLAAGPFLQKMYNEWEQKKNETIIPKDRKIFLYAAHDVTIVNILTAIDVWDTQLPAYGIMAIFELLEHKETGEYGVQIFLRNSSGSGAIPLTLPSCEHFCPLDKFIKLTKNIIPENLELECESKFQNISTSYV